MTEHGSIQLGPELEEKYNSNIHLKEYLDGLYNKEGEYPLFIDIDEATDYEDRRPNILYQLNKDVFVNIYGTKEKKINYNIIQPKIDGELFDEVRRRIQRDASKYKLSSADDKEVIEDHIENILNDISVNPNDSFKKIRKKIGNIPISQEQHRALRYLLVRDIHGIGKLNPLLQDKYNEDIHLIGKDECYVDNKVYGLIPVDNLSFESDIELDKYLKNLGERINNPVSDSEPILDNTLPDGSRINIIYSSDVSAKGPSLTIRQGDEVPLSILEITKWGTLSPKMVAYLWLALENDRTIFVVGETASGKTTTLNALLSFIPNNTKIYTAEDTSEVKPPQETWQKTLTRETKGNESTDVDMFDLVEAALRSRPKYVIVGEVRGEEAQMAFQAAQTGHPVMLTFHASDIKSMIQRFTGNPINVPKTFMDNCDIALFQNRVESENPNEDMLRRVTKVNEIIGYSEKQDGVITREVFQWDPINDEHLFNGNNNSYIMEEKVAELMGYEDKTKIYDEIDRRAKIISRLIDSEVLDYYDVNDAINQIQRNGVESVRTIRTSDLV